MNLFIDDNNFNSTGNSRTKRAQTGLSLGKSRSLIGKEEKKTDDLLTGMREEESNEFLYCCKRAGNEI